MTEPVQNKSDSGRGGYRRWSEAQKRQIVAETRESGTSVSVVARRHDLNTNQLFQWRKKFEAENGVLALAGFVPVKVEKPKSLPSGGLIMIELRCGIVVRVEGNVDGDALRRVLSVVGETR